MYDTSQDMSQKLIKTEKSTEALIDMFGVHKDIHGRDINAKTEVAGHLAGDYMLKVFPDGSCERCYPYHPDFPKELKH